MSQKNDINDPILIIVRRGRKGRGYTVAPVEDAANPAMVMTKEELGEVIEEMINDENQPRVDINELMAASGGARTQESRDDEPSGHRRAPQAEEDSGEAEGDEEDEEYEEDEEDDGIFSGVAGAEDPADRLLVNLFTHAIKKGQSMSSKPRKPRSRVRQRRKKK